MRCRICGLSFGHAATPGTVAKKKCKGPLHARVLDSLGIGHEMVQPCAYTIAEMRALGAEPWRGGAAGATASSADTAHGHGMQEGRRRLTFKQPPPPAYRCGDQSAVHKEKDSGHLLVRKGRITFCDRCGRWAIHRLSPGLLRRCAGSVDTALGAYRVRRDRLRQGRHPLTGAKLD